MSKSVRAVCRKKITDDVKNVGSLRIVKADEADELEERKKKQVYHVDRDGAFPAIVAPWADKDELLLEISKAMDVGLPVYVDSLGSSRKGLFEQIEDHAYEIASLANGLKALSLAHREDKVVFEVGDYSVITERIEGICRRIVALAMAADELK